MTDPVDARGLRAALRVLRPTCMAPARRFLLRRDASLDLVVLSAPDVVRHAALLAGDCELAGAAGYATDAVLVPFLNVAGYNFGIFVTGHRVLQMCRQTW
jgi:hypothetical protein